MRGHVPGIASRELPLVHRFRGSNHIDIVNLVLRSALLRASRRTATGEMLPAPSFETPCFARLLRMRSVD